MISVRWLAFVPACALLACSLIACSDAPRSSGAPASDEAPAAAAPDARASTDIPDARPADAPRIVILGDSLTAGLGLPVEQSFPSLLQERLDREGYEYEVVNAGVSGDTSAGGLRRLDWALEGNVEVLVVALGGNDGLRGLPVTELKRNLTAIVDEATERGVKVVLAGMEAPPNNGPEYTAAFRRVYRDLARERDLPFIPFLLDGVAGNASLNQADGIHPNAQGARLVADLVWDTLEPALSRTSGDHR